ncbi:hypothetical protein JTB14_010172 [Gonioctena quinquepunctata]|nr:hypothetical protein JTB14_010172 [Gonioctena quinquepunctata]
MSRYEACLGSKGAKKISFTCRFCTANTIVFPTLFYDHLSTHTGEYRHICPNCNISFCGAKTLKFHMNTGHKDEAKPIVRKSYNSTIMFGYLCGECNYVQVNEKNVEEHVNIYHLVRPPIYKVNLSSHFDEEIEKMQKTLDSSDSVTAVINEVVQNDEENNEVPEPVPVRKKPGPKKKSIAIIKEPPTLSTDADPLEKTQPEIVPPKRRRSGPKPGPKSKKKMLEKKYLQSKEVESDCTTDTESVSSKQRSDKEEQASINENKEKKKVDESTKEDSEVNSEKIAKEVVKKEIEMNVFTCKTDIQEENKKIEQERLKTMDELNRSVGSRTSLNFVDKLCNRLSKNDIILKQEPTDDLTDSLFRRESSQSPLSMPILEKNPPTIPPNIPTDIPSSVPPVIESVEPAIETPITPPVTQPRIKNPVLEPEDPHLLSPSYDVTQKNDRIIVDMIEKLKGKLGTPGTENDSSVDNAINIEDDDDDEGPPPLTHVNQLVNIKPTDSFTKTLQIGGLVKLIKTVDSTTFCCLVPPCVFSTDHKDVFQRHCRERHAASSLGRNTTLCEICGVQIETTLEASLLENLFKHTITEHADFLKDTVIHLVWINRKLMIAATWCTISADAEANVSPQKRMLRIRKLSGDALSVIKKDWEEEIDIHQGKSQANNPSDNNEDNQTVEAATKTTDVSAEEEAAPSFAEIETTDDNPFPFKIAGVMSLAEPQPPPLTPIAKQSMHLVVKEAKLNTAELAKPKKTPKALNKFIEDVSNLYKCPHYFCLFTTNFRDFLERHLKAHNTEQDVMIPCVYCDLKTPWEHVPMHIDIRHANCRFSCSYCLYRAAVKEYVFLHQDRAHPTKDYSVIALPSMKIHKKFAIADVKIDPKTLCEPYKCTQFCSMEFLFENEFRKHLIEFHNQSTFMSCGHENCRSRVLACKMTQHWSSVHNVSLYQCGYCKMSCSDIKQMYHHFSKSHQNLTPDILIRMVTPVPDTITLGYSAEAFRRMRKIVSIPSNITSDDKTG